MKAGRRQEHQAEPNMQIPPLGFAQGQKAPIRPIGDPSGRGYGQDKPAQGQDEKRKRNHDGGESPALEPGRRRWGGRGGVIFRGVHLRGFQEFSERKITDEVKVLISHSSVMTFQWFTNLEVVTALHRAGSRTLTFTLAFAFLLTGAVLGTLPLAFSVALRD